MATPRWYDTFKDAIMRARVSLGTDATARSMVLTRYANEIQWAHQVLVVNAYTNNLLADKATDPERQTAQRTVLRCLAMVERNPEIWRSIEEAPGRGIAVWPCEILDAVPTLRTEAMRRTPRAVEHIDNMALICDVVPPFPAGPGDPASDAFADRYGQNFYWSTAVLLNVPSRYVNNLARTSPISRHNAANSFVDLMLLTKPVARALQFFEELPQRAKTAERVMLRHSLLAERITTAVPDIRETMHRLALAGQPARDQRRPPEVPVVPLNGVGRNETEPRAQARDAAAGLARVVMVLNNPARYPDDVAAPFRDVFLDVLEVTSQNQHFKDQLLDPTNSYAGQVVTILAQQPTLFERVQERYPELLEQIVHAHASRDSVPQFPASSKWTPGTGMSL